MGHIPRALSNPPPEHLPGLRQSRGGVDRGGRGELNNYHLHTDTVPFLSNGISLDTCLCSKSLDVQVYYDSNISALVFS